MIFQHRLHQEEQNMAWILKVRNLSFQFSVMAAFCHEKTEIPWFYILIFHSHSFSCIRILFWARRRKSLLGNALYLDKWMLSRSSMDKTSENIWYDQHWLIYFGFPWRPRQWHTSDWSFLVERAMSAKPLTNWNKITWVIDAETMAYS